MQSQLRCTRPLRHRALPKRARLVHRLGRHHRRRRRRRRLPRHHRHSRRSCCIPSSQLARPPNQACPWTTASPRAGELPLRRQMQPQPQPWRQRQAALSTSAGGSTCRRCHRFQQEALCWRCFRAISRLLLLLLMPRRRGPAAAAAAPRPPPAAPPTAGAAQLERIDLVRRWILSLGGKKAVPLACLAYMAFALQAYFATKI